MQAFPVILFDGDCGLCDAAVRFVMARDGGRFRFAAQSSDVARRLLAEHHLDGESLNSIVLIEDGRAYTKSTAALLVAVGLTGLWPMLGALAYVPIELRDAAYDFIARHRKIVPKRTDCPIPTDEQRARFLDAAG